MSNFRLEILFKPCHVLTTVGSQIYVTPKTSYLHILNCVELVKINTTNSQPLKIGESFYLLFHFSGQYIYYDSIKKGLGLTKDLNERTLFKILTEQFDWNNRGKIQIGMLFKYRIILAQQNSQFLCNENGILSVSSNYDEKSFVSFQKSLYSLDSLSYPIKLTSLENGMTLCYKNFRACAQKNPSTCQSMLSLQNKDNTELWGVKHVDSNNYLVNSNGKFIFMKQAPQQLKYFIKIRSYNQKGNYLYLQTSERCYLKLNSVNGDCEEEVEALLSIMKKQEYSEEIIKSILISAWLKSELDLPPNENNILFILEECEQSFQQFSQVYDEIIVEGLVIEGILQDLDFISKKYPWQLVEPKIASIIKLMLRIKRNFIIDLFNTFNLYKNIMETDEQIREIVECLQLKNQELSNPSQALQAVQDVIINDKVIDLTCLSSILVISTLLKSLVKYPQYKLLKEFLDYTCSQLIPQIQKQTISSFFCIGLKIIKANYSSLFFAVQIMAKLSLNLLENENLTLQDKMILIEVFIQQTGPYAYLASQSQTVRMIDHERKNQNCIALFIEDILPKSCRFQTYENKMIAVALIPFHLRIKHILEINDCKEYIKYLLDSINSYSFQENPSKFLHKSLQSLLQLLNRTIVLICQKSLQFDSITQQLSDRISKCKKQFSSFLHKKILNIPLIWSIFVEKAQLSSQNEEEVFITALKIYEKLICPQKYFQYYLTILKVIDEPSPYLSKAITLFLQREYEFNPIEMTQKIMLLMKKGLQEEELLVIASLIHQNNLYDKICFKVEAFYEVINGLTTVQNLNESQLNGEKMLNVLRNRSSEWIYTDQEFAFLKNALILIGGVVSMNIFQFYETYICSVRPESWTLTFFDLCLNFFTMSPIGLKKKFILIYQYELKSSHWISKLQKIFSQKQTNFIIFYIDLLLNFSTYNSNKQLMYPIIGDQLAFKLIQKFSGNYMLMIKILVLMIKTRKRRNQYEIITVDPENVFWLKRGTLFIRKLLETSTEQFIKQVDFTLLKDFTIAMIDFLEMREQVSAHTELLDDEMLVIEGTNKMIAFEIVDMIQIIAQNKEIESGWLDKIQWFENQYKINVNSLQLAHMSIEQQAKQVKSNQNFVYSYMLEVKDYLEQAIDSILTKISIEVLVTTLIRIVIHLSMSKSPNWANLQILLNYLHCIVTQKRHIYKQAELKSLFLSMRKLTEHKKLNLVAITQNITRKIIWKDGILEVQNQYVIQHQIMEHKAEFNELIYDCINNYMIFSPTYSSTANFFNQNGQDNINWSVSCYISMLRFLICLSKSLQLKFKQIFSQNQVLRKQFIGSLIELNRQHISQLVKDTSDIKLTLIAYEIQLINNMMRGPVILNIEVAIKFKYEGIISLISLPDLSNDPNRLNTFKIIVEIKKLVAQAILILASFQRFNSKQIKIIEEGLIVYFKKTEKLAFNLDKVIEKYKKQYKNKLQVMNFDLALNLFFCLIRIYEKEQNPIIRRMRTDTLKRTRLIKSYNKRFKMLYQIYRILVDLVQWIARSLYRCCKMTATQIDQAMNLFQWSDVSHEENLREAFEFFVKNVASIEVQVGQQIETIYFLLMMETRCYNVSIRKELHRKIGLGDRDYRLSKFLQQSRHVILRLEIEKSIKQFTEKYKPIEIIIKNRQLWKSLNFLCACLLNFIFLALNIFPDPQVPLYILRALSYIFCIFLFTIYFIQNLPLKRKLAQQMETNDKISKFKKIKSCLEIFNDKTLWFASIYFIIISLSIYQLGVVCILMIDFFVRFKISKKVTQIITRPIKQLVIIILLSVVFAFVFTCYTYFIGKHMDCSNTSSCIQYTYQFYLGLYKNDTLQEEMSRVNLNDIVDFFFSFFAVMINNSLIISVLLYEKKAKDNKINQWNLRVKQRCFICDAERNIVDRSRNNNKGFFEHIEEEHSLWNYIFYLVYLKNKEQERLNIVQTMILEQWKNNQYFWLPKIFVTRYT